MRSHSSRCQDAWDGDGHSFEVAVFRCPLAFINGLYHYVFTSTSPSELDLAVIFLSASNHEHQDVAGVMVETQYT